MSERLDAVRLAHAILDRPGADPDDDLAVLARQFLRMREKVAECGWTATRGHKDGDHLNTLRDIQRITTCALADMACALYVPDDPVRAFAVEHVDKMVCDRILQHHPSPPA